MNKDSKIYVAGHRGLVGSAIVRKLLTEGYKNIITRTKKELDLTNQQEVFKFFEQESPEYVFLAAAKVGGIMYNKLSPADFIRENLLIQTNVIDSAYKSKVKKLLFLGSSCVYPKVTPQPIQETYLLSSELENSNLAYAVAKIAGIVMCQKYTEQYGFETISLMPTNIYGAYDNFNTEEGHVLPALIAKFIEAKEKNLPNVTCWGDGSSRREFLISDDLADAAIFLMNNYSDSDIINVGTGKDISVKELAEIIKEEVGYEGSIVWDTEKPNGTMRKLLDTSKIQKLGWSHRIGLREGIRFTIQWFREHRTDDN